MYKTSFILLLSICLSQLSYPNNYTDSLQKCATKYTNQYQIDSANYCYQLILEHFNEQTNINNVELRNNIEYEYASSLEKLGEYMKAAPILIALSEKYSTDNKYYVKIQLTLALLFQKARFENECFERLKEISSLVELRHTDLLPSYYYRYAKANYVFGKMNSASENLNKALFFSDLHNDHINYHKSILLKSLLVSPSNLSLALEYQHKALSYFTNINDKYYRGVSEYCLSVSYYKLDILDSAMFYANKTYNTVKHTTMELKGHPAHIKAKIFEKINKLDSATYYYKEGYKKKLKILKLKDKGEVKYISKKFEDYKKQSIINKKEKELKIVFVMFFILLLVLIIMVRLSRKNTLLLNQNKNQKNILAKKNEALNDSLHQEQLLLRELHHRVKNNLQLILSLLELKSNKDQSNEITSRVYCIAAFHNLMYRDKIEDKVEIINYINELTEYIIRSIYIYENPPKIDLEIESLKLNIETMIPLGLIINELFTNTIKHVSSKTKELEVSILIKRAENNSYILMYKDNGKGEIKDGTKPNALGLFIIKSMVRQIMGKLTIDNSNGLSYKIYFTEKNNL